MQIKIPTLDQDLDSIKSFLDRHVNPNPKKLKNFSKQLKKIDRSLEATLSENDSSFAHISVERQRELVKRLAGRCHQLEIRRNVIDMAENAEELANSSPERSHDEVASEANALRGRIEAFLKDHRPSQTNAKFIRFAKACLAKAEKGEPVIVKKRVSLESYQRPEVTPESYELAEQLYELAGLLYQGEIEEFLTKFASFSSEDLKFHIQNCGADLANLEKRSSQLHAIQGILGYAHLLTDYYTDTTPYPTLIEIHNTFEDLDFVKHLEEE